MADQRRIDMKMSGKPEEEAWIKMINGERPTAAGNYIKTKADLLKVKKYMGMVTGKVRAAYEKRLAELSRNKSTDSVDSIAAKYGYQVQQNDAAVTPIELTKTATSVVNELRNNPSAATSKIRLTSLKLMLKKAKFEYQDAVKYAEDIVKECEKLIK